MAEFAEGGDWFWLGVVMCLGRTSPGLEPLVVPPQLAGDSSS